jgi:hypothetical protein
MPEQPTDLLPFHLWDLRSQLEAQVRRVVDAQRFWDERLWTSVPLAGATMVRIVACLDAVRAASVSIDETCGGNG